MMKVIKIGCNGLIVRDNQLLLGKRKNIYGAGTYGLPGGHLEYGEKAINATKRELEEECGIVATQLEFNSLLDQNRSNEHYLQINFMVKAYDGQIKCSEPDTCEGWEWFPLDKLPKNIFPPHQQIIKAYLNQQNYSY